MACTGCPLDGPYSRIIGRLDQSRHQETPADVVSALGVPRELALHVAHVAGGIAASLLDHLESVDDDQDRWRDITWSLVLAVALGFEAGKERLNHE